MTPPPAKIKLPTAKAHDAPGTLIEVPVGDIKVLKGLNVRVDLTNLDELIASIKANGFFRDKPLAAYSSEDGLIVVDGHRRLAAVKAINDAALDPVITSLPVVVKPEATSLAEIHIAQVQSATGEPLTMFEKGIAVKRIMADGMSKEDVAAAFGVTTKSIDNYIAIASAPTPVRNMLLDGKVKETHVLRAVKKKGVDAVATLQGMVDRAKKVGRTVARAGDAVSDKTTFTSGGPSPASVGETVSLLPTAPATTMVDKGVDPDNTVTVEITKDAAMGPVLKEIAKTVRSLVPHDTGEDDFAHVSGTVTITVTLAKEPRKRKPKADPVPAELAHAIPAEDEL